MAHLEADVAHYIDEMVRIARQESGEIHATKVANLAKRFGRIRQEIARLKAMDAALAEAPDGQISLTDPDARAMATSARRSGLVGYNVQSAVDTENLHLFSAFWIAANGRCPRCGKRNAAFGERCCVSEGRNSNVGSVRSADLHPPKMLPHGRMAGLVKLRRGIGLLDGRPVWAASDGGPKLLDFNGLGDCERVFKFDAEVPD